MVFFPPKIDKTIAISPQKYDLDKKFFKEILFLIEFPPFHNHAVFPIETILPTGVDLPLLQV